MLRVCLRGLPGSGPVEVRAGRDAGPVLALLAALATGLLDQGAYFGRTSWSIGVLVLIAGLATWVGRPGPVLDRLAALVLAAGALAAWAVVDGALHGSARAGVRPAILLLGLTVVLVTGRGLSDWGRESLVGGLLAAGLLVAGTGWLGVVLHFRPWGLVAEGLWRASSSITYPNAAAAVLTPLALVAVARLTHRPRSVPLGLSSTGLAVGVAATGSRAGLLGLAAGLLVLMVLLGSRAVVRSARAPLAGAVLAVVGMLPSVPQGSSPRPALAGLALLAGLTLAVGLPRIPRSAAGAAAAVAGALAAGGAAIPAVSAAAQTVAGRRGTLASPDRVGALRAALEQVAASPLTGAGPGRASLYWTGSDGHNREILYAHNEYLQVTAEMGLVGGALLAVLLGAVAQLLIGSRRTTPAHLWAGTASGLIALGAHSGLDFLWHLPVVPLLAATLLGLATRSRPTGPPSGSDPTPKEAPCQHSAPAPP